MNGFMVSEILSVFWHCPYSVTFHYARYAVVTDSSSGPLTNSQ